MDRVYRQDAIKLDNVIIDGLGILRATAKIARIGTMEYVEDGNIVVEMRFPEDVIESKDSFSAQVITLDHPPEMVDSTNAEKYSKGLSGDQVEYVDGWLKTNITVTHADAVDAARSTHKQFSNGYWAQLIEESGVWIDEAGVQGKPGKEYHYDRVQKNIVGNHIALVQAARAGSQATFTDSTTFIIDHDEQSQNKTIKVKSMVQIIHTDGHTVFNIEGDDAQNVNKLVTDLKTNLDKANADRTKAETEVNKKDQEINDLKKANSELDAKADSLAEKVKELEDAGMTPDYFEVALNDRVYLWGEVKAAGITDSIDPKLDSVSIKKLLLTHKLPNLKDKIDKGDENYINALWDVKDDFGTSTKSDQSKDDFVQDNKTKTNDASDFDPVEKARQDYAARRSNKQ